MFEESVSSAPTFWAGLNSWFTPTVFFVVLQLVIGTIYITSTLTNKVNHKHHQEQQQQQQQQQQDPQVPDFQHPQLARSPSVLQRLKSINFYSSYPYRSQQEPQPQIHNPQEYQNHEQQHQQLLRSPSLLQRFKSINLYSYFPTEPFTSNLTTTDTNVSNTTRITYEPEKQQQQHVYDTAVVETDEETEDDDDDVVLVGKIKDNLEEHVEGGFASSASSSMDDIYSKLQGQDGHFARTQSDTKPASGEVPVKLPRKMKKSASSKSAFSHFKEDDIVESRRPATVREKKVSAAATADDNEVDAKADDFINKFKQQLKLQRLDSILNYKEMIGRGS